GDVGDHARHHRDAGARPAARELDQRGSPPLAPSGGARRVLTPRSLRSAARAARAEIPSRVELLGARPKTSWVANRTRGCSVGITPDCPAAAGEASAADEHARFHGRRRPPQSPTGTHERRETSGTARVRSAAL